MDNVSRTSAPVGAATFVNTPGGEAEALGGKAEEGSVLHQSPPACLGDRDMAPVGRMALNPSHSPPRSVGHGPPATCHLHPLPGHPGAARRGDGEPGLPPSSSSSSPPQRWPAGRERSPKQGTALQEPSTGAASSRSCNINNINKVQHPALTHRTPCKTLGPSGCSRCHLRAPVQHSRRGGDWDKSSATQP